MSLNKFQKKWKKAAAILTAVTLAAGMLTGCAKGQQGDEGSAKAGADASADTGQDGAKGGGTPGAMGRYVEQDMEAPWGEDDTYCYSCKDLDGKLQILLYDADMSMKQYQYDGNWSEADCDWINEIINQGNSVYWVRYGQDGAYYLLAQEEAAAEEADAESAQMQPIPWHFYTHTDSGTEELKLSVLSAEAQKSQVFYPFYMEITQSGDIAFLSSGNEDVIVYDRASGKQKAELSTHRINVSEDQMFLMEGDILATLADNETDIVFYDTQTGKEEKRIAIGEQKQGNLAGGGEGRYYLANKDGIWSFREDGSILEQVFDGSLGSMSASSQMMRDFETGSAEDFYIVYSSENISKVEVKHYVYDEEALSVPSQTLTVYGLQENSKITEAVHVFQKENPDVKVEYQYAYDEYDLGETEDIIKALNTELLGGQGADVLVLDGLPMDSYIEKGVLADISALGGELEKNGTVLKAVLEGAKKDGKIYSIPTGMVVPVMYGTDELRSAMQSLDSLEKYMEKNEKALVTGVNGYSRIARMLFALDYANALDENGVVQQDEIARILKDAKKIGDNNNQEYMEKFQQEWTEVRKEATDRLLLTTPFDLSGCETYYDETCVGMKGVSACYGLADICDAQKPLNLKAESIHGYYVPSSILGITEISGQKELAQAFIETVLSDAVQTATERDLPVRVESIDNLAKVAEGKTLYSMGSSGWDGIMHNYGYPTAEEMKPFIEIFKQVETPFVLDSTVQEAFLDAADRYFNDGLSEEVAAEEMAQTVDTYLAE